MLSSTVMDTDDFWPQDALGDSDDEVQQDGLSTYAFHQDDGPDDEVGSDVTELADESDVVQRSSEQTWVKKRPVRQPLTHLLNDELEVIDDESIILPTNSSSTQSVEPADIEGGVSKIQAPAKKMGRPKKSIPRKPSKSTLMNDPYHLLLDMVNKRRFIKTKLNKMKEKVSQEAARIRSEEEKDGTIFPSNEAVAERERQVTSEDLDETTTTIIPTTTTDSISVPIASSSTSFAPKVDPFLELANMLSRNSTPLAIKPPSSLSVPSASSSLSTDMSSLSTSSVAPELRSDVPTTIRRPVKGRRRKAPSAGSEPVAKKRAADEPFMPVKSIKGVSKNLNWKYVKMRTSFHWICTSVALADPHDVKPPFYMPHRSQEHVFPNEGTPWWLDLSQYSPRVRTLAAFFPAPFLPFRFSRFAQSDNRSSSTLNDQHICFYNSPPPELLKRGNRLVFALNPNRALLTDDDINMTEQIEQATSVQLGNSMDIDISHVSSEKSARNDFQVPLPSSSSSIPDAQDSEDDRHIDDVPSVQSLMPHDRLLLDDLHPSRIGISPLYTPYVSKADALSLRAFVDEGGQLMKGIPLTQDRIEIDPIEAVFSDANATFHVDDLNVLDENSDELDKKVWTTLMKQFHGLVEDTVGSLLDHYTREERRRRRLARTSRLETESRESRDTGNTETRFLKEDFETLSRPLRLTTATHEMMTVETLSFANELMSELMDHAIELGQERVEDPAIVADLHQVTRSYMIVPDALPSLGLPMTLSNRISHKIYTIFESDMMRTEAPIGLIDRLTRTTPWEHLYIDPHLAKMPNSEASFNSYETELKYRLRLATTKNKYRRGKEVKPLKVDKETYNRREQELHLRPISHQALAARKKRRPSINEDAVEPDLDQQEIPEVENDHDIFDTQEDDIDAMHVEEQTQAIHEAEFGADVS